VTTDTFTPLLKFSGVHGDIGQYRTAGKSLHSQMRKTVNRVKAFTSFTILRFQTGDRFPK
jgi:hypothetical protein